MAFIFLLWPFTHRQTSTAGHGSASDPGPRLLAWNLTSATEFPRGPIKCLICTHQLMFQSLQCPVLWPCPAVWASRHPGEPEVLVIHSLTMVQSCPLCTGLRDPRCHCSNLTAAPALSWALPSPWLPAGRAAFLPSSSPPNLQPLPPPSHFLCSSFETHPSSSSSC